MSRYHKFFIFLFCVWLLSPMAVGAASDPSAPLTQEIESKRRQIEVLGPALDLEAEKLMRDMQLPENSPRRLEAKYLQLMVLLNISIANPYEERTLYNQMFQLESQVGSLKGRYLDYNRTISIDLMVLEDSKRELNRLLSHQPDPKLVDSISRFKIKLDQLIGKLEQTRTLLEPRLTELLDLNREMQGSLKMIRTEVPDLLIDYLLNLSVSLLAPENYARLALAPDYWLLGQPSQSLAKMPGEWDEWALLLVLSLLCGGIVFFLNRKQLLFFSAKTFRSHPEAEIVFRRILILAPLSVAFLIGSLFIDFPSNVLPLQIGSVLALLTGLKTAWCMRTMRLGPMPASPLMPLFWTYVAGVTLQFLHIPLILTTAIWPFVLLGTVIALYRMRKRKYPGLESSFIDISLGGLILLLLLSLEGHVYPAVLFTMWWALTAVCIQLGSAVGAVLKTRSEELFQSEKSRTRGILFSMCTPLAWITLLVVVLAWTLSQFGEIRLLYRIMGKPGILSSLLVLMLTVMIIRLLTSLDAAYSARVVSGKRPLRGFMQVAKLFVLIIGLGTAVSLFLERSPWALLGGVGAVAAALLFVFKDTILSLVAGVRIVMDDLVRIDDWIEIQDMGVDGDVIDVTLYSVKVRNFDRTIVTVPTITLIEHSFKNWRGMKESGGRRIKRTIPIDMSSIFFLDDQWIERLEKIDRLKNWFQDNKVERLTPRPPHNPTSPELLNTDNLTNLEAFRAYADEWLRSHEDIHQGLTFLVRTLEPEADQGLPFQIYVFANDTDWGRYETIQARVLDQLVAALPIFALRAYQRNALPDKRPSVEAPGLAGL